MEGCTERLTGAWMHGWMYGARGCTMHGRRGRRVEPCNGDTHGEDACGKVGCARGRTPGAWRDRSATRSATRYCDWFVDALVSWDITTGARTWTILEAVARHDAMRPVTAYRHVSLERCGCCCCLLETGCASNDCAAASWTTMRRVSNVIAMNT